MKKQNIILLISMFVITNANLIIEQKPVETHANLDSLEMDLFNTILETKPKVTHAIKKALRIVKIEFKKLKEHKEKDKYNITNNEIIEYRNNILMQLKPFFTKIFMYKSMTKTLVDKSLKDFPNSLLVKFFAVNEKEGDTYFEKQIDTAQKLENSCLEFIKFLDDIEHNLSKEAKQAYVDLANEIKEQKKKIALQNKVKK